MHFKKRILTYIFGSSLLLPMAHNAYAQEATAESAAETEGSPETVKGSGAEDAKGPITVEMILDASGSMYKEVQGETRIQTAKKMLEAFLKGLEADGTRIALRTFGHRAESKSCKESSIELKLDFYPKDFRRMRKIIHEIDPQYLAKTPLAKAMNLAHKDLLKREGRRNLVVVTDGEDTCKGDPCKMAAKLRKDLDVKVYLVAYGVKDPKKFKQLECIGDVPSGANPTPDTGQQFADTLAKIKQQIQGGQQTILIQGPDPTAWAEATNTADKKKVFRFVASQGTPMEPGDYRIKVEYSTPYYFSNVKLKPKEIKVLKVKGEGGIVARFLHPSLKMVAQNIETGQKYIWKGEKELALEAGQYVVAAQTTTGLAYQWPTVGVAPNASPKLDMPPWGALSVVDNQRQPFRVFKLDNKTVAKDFFAVQAKKGQSDPELPLDKLIKQQEPLLVGMTNTELVLEAGSYVVVLADSHVYPKVSVSQGKLTELKKEPNQ